MVLETSGELAPLLQWLATLPLAGIRIEPPSLPPAPAGEGGVWAGGRDGRGPDVLEVTANFLVVRTMQDGAMCLFAAGRYVDRVERTAAGWKFARKEVVLDSRQIDTLLAIPL